MAALGAIGVFVVALLLTCMAMVGAARLARRALAAGTRKRARLGLAIAAGAALAGAFAVAALGFVCIGAILYHAGR
ncbi:MAG: hypothetical protein AB7M12_00105 [Hyphomonadaceae bacterium]